MRDKNKFIVSARKTQNNPSINKFITIVLLGENYGYRMKSHGAIPLIKLTKEKTLLDIQINIIKSVFKNYEIILCSGFQTEKINNFIKSKFSNENIRIVENQVHYNSNCCESARLSLNNTNNERILLCSGDILLTRSFLNSIKYDQNCIVCQDKNYNEQFCAFVTQNKDQLNNLSLGGKSNFWIDAIYLNGHQSIMNLYNIISNVDYKTKFLFEAINDFCKQNKVAVMKNKDNDIIKINNIKTLKEIQR